MLDLDADGTILLLQIQRGLLPMTTVNTLLGDVRHGVRSLRRDWGATIFIVGIAGLGSGASTTVFSISRALLLRPLPLREPDRLVWIANGNSENLSAQTVQVNNLLELRETSRSYSDVAGFSPFYAPGDIRLTGTGEPERITGVPVTQSFFAMLGVQPLAGRFFDPSESLWHAPRTVVLGHDFWERRFNGDRGIVGRAIMLDDEPVTVIGVLPASFDFAATFTPGRRADVFVPFPLSAETNRQGNTLALIGRLREGVALETARTEAAGIGARIQSGRVDGGRQRNAFTPRLSALRERVSGRFTSALVVLASAVGFLMLLVCANISTLLLVRASSRRREMAVRAALGASRSDLVRLTLVESLLLGAGGAVLGVVLAIGGTFAVSRIQGTTVPLLNAVAVDAGALTFTVLVAVITGVAFGLLPAFQGSSFGLSTVLAEGTRGSTEGRGGRMRRVIVASEIALVCVLLTGAGLLTRSLGRVLSVHPGFSTENIMAVRVDPGRTRSAEQMANYFDAVVREVGAVPGVQAIGLTDALPLGDNFGWRRWDASPAERPNGEGEPLLPLVRMIDEGYLKAMQIPLRAGRAFATADDASSEPVIIINERLSRSLWVGQDPIGRYVRTSGRNRRVVGVVGDVRYFGLDKDADPEMYMPLRTGDFQSVDLVVRGLVPPATMVSGIRAALRRLDPDLPVAEFRTMEQLVDRSVFTRRFVVMLVAGFAVFGLILASLGIYAVVSYSVAQRTQEFGIRMALGATPRGLLARTLWQTGALVLAGVAVGLPASWMAARAIRGMLFDVSAFDPVTFATMLALLGSAAALAGYVPARRATKVDPTIALRPQ
jgi:predicted permease